MIFVSCSVIFLLFLKDEQIKYHLSPYFIRSLTPFKIIVLRFGLGFMCAGAACEDAGSFLTRLPDYTIS
jgi:hypothetical protein